MARREFILGTHGTRLARCQAAWVAAAFRRSAPRARVAIKTIPARHHQQLCSGAAGTSAATCPGDLEQALLDGVIDLASHSLKDLASQTAEGLCLAATPRRLDARDAVVSRPDSPLTGLSGRGRVGTSSARRRGQLLQGRPALTICPLRGSIENRLRRLDDGDFDAVLVAAAGLRWLGLGHRIAELVPPEVLLPAPGQGALAIQARADDAEVRAAIEPLDHAPTRAAVEAERMVLRHIGGERCVPLGAFATADNGGLTLDACIAALDGSALLRRRATAEIDQAAELGRRVAETLRADGGADLLAEAERTRTE